ncbi:MAG: beta-lactamase family protein, partial [Gemmatimonadota bacterium]|nr:beta-lactamase family protein [Gemmatimonadota bacterium]
MRRTAACCLVVLVSLSPSPLLGQDPGPLAVGDERTITLAPGEASEFTMELLADQFVYGEVHQEDGDVRLSLLGPGNDILATFDALDRGPEPFVVNSEASGTFRIRVESTEEGTTVSPRLRLISVEAIAEDPADRLDQLLRPYTGTDRPGVAVGIVRDGALRLTRAYGMANLEHSVPFRPATISNIGSVSKQFTAMALLLLEQDGKLSLDDDVREHLPEVPDLGDPVTLRNLLNHTGGYREIYNLLPLTGYRGEDGFDRSRAIQVVQRQTERQAPPNTEFNYNNTGYILLSHVVERVSGQSFDAFMDARVFRPLGMSDTRVKMVQGQVIPGSAQGYVPEEGRGYRTARDLAASAGAGGIYTTVSDLARWLGNYSEPALAGADGVRQLTTSAVLANGDTTGYGLGLGVSTRRGRRLYAHTGGDVAHRAYLGYYPEFGGGVIIMSNNALFDLGLGAPLADLFFSAEFEPMEEKVAEGGGVAVAAARLEALAGEWVIED